MKRYSGERRKDGSAKVVVWDDISFGMKFARYTTLDPRPDLCPPPSHSDYAWGISSPGALALATAILADCIGDQRAQVHAPRFAAQVVSRFAAARWKIDEDAVCAALGLDRHERAQPPATTARPARQPAATGERQLSALAAWLADGRRGGPALRLT